MSNRITTIYYRPDTWLGQTYICGQTRCERHDEILKTGHEQSDVFKTVVLASKNSPTTQGGEDMCYSCYKEEQIYWDHQDEY